MKKIEKEVKYFCEHNGYIFFKQKKKYCILDNCGFHYFYDEIELSEYLEKYDTY